LLADFGLVVRNVFAKLLLQSLEITAFHYGLGRLKMLHQKSYKSNIGCHQ